MSVTFRPISYEDWFPWKDRAINKVKEFSHQYPITTDALVGAVLFAALGALIPIKTLNPLLSLAARAFMGSCAFVLMGRVASVEMRRNVSVKEHLVSKKECI